MDKNTERYRNVGLELVGCPQCAAPAEIVERFVLGSVAGPVEHVTVRCVLRHWFALPATQVAATSPAPRPDGKETSR
jgi:hypothetical protein